MKSTLDDIVARFECTSDVVKEHELFDELVEHARKTEKELADLKAKVSTGYFTPGYGDCDQC